MDTQKLREAIEALLKIEGQLWRLAGTLPIGIDKYRDALILAIDTCQKVLDLQGVMPKKKEITQADWDMKNCPVSVGDMFYAENKIIDLCILAVAGKDNLVQLEIDYLKGELK